MRDERQQAGGRSALSALSATWGAVLVVGERLGSGRVSETPGGCRGGQPCAGTCHCGCGALSSPRRPAVPLTWNVLLRFECLGLCHLKCCSSLWVLWKYFVFICFSTFNISYVLNLTVKYFPCFVKFIYLLPSYFSLIFSKLIIQIVIRY